VVDHHPPGDFAVVGLDDLVALLVEKAGEYFESERIVVDKKDLHRPLLPRTIIAEPPLTSKRAAGFAAARKSQHLRETV
jgi:hypothetical protein